MPDDKFNKEVFELEEKLLHSGTNEQIQQKIKNMKKRKKKKLLK